MERARHRKTKSASGIEGIRQIQKQKAIPRLSSDSRCYINGSNRDDMYMLELARSSLRGATGIPMKKLLAEEMSKDVESKRRSPSIIARLMGLEGLPSPRHVHRQQEKFPDNYQQKKVSINVQKNGQLYDGRSNKRSSMDQQEFKDVYEDLEASHVANRRCSSSWNATNSFLSKPEMAMIQQKFVDAKRLSTDEKLQDSKELDDTLEMLDSNKDLLLKFLGQPGSVFVKHLHDLPVDTGSSLGSHIAVLKPLNSEKYESKAKSWESERDTSTKPHVASHLKREDSLLLEPHCCHRAHVRNSSRTQVEEKNEEKMLPTKIVVLKSNLGKMQNAGTSCSSPNLSHGHLYGFKKINKYPSTESSETVSRRRKNPLCNVGLSKTMSKEAREIAREITMRMREGYDETMDAKSTGYRGYIGDESSYDANESDSESEYEVFKFSSRRSFDDSNMWRYPSLGLGESSVNKEGKKRLSERWKKTHKYQNLKMVSWGSTLGEMLAFSDKETRPNHLNAGKNLDRISNRLGSNNGNALLDGPLGISSSDGWKDEICRNSSRSRSVPPSTSGRRRSHRRSSYHDKLAEDKNLMHGETVLHSRSKVLKGNLSDKEDYLSSDMMSRSNKYHACHQIFTNKIDSSSEANFEIQMEPNAKDLTERRSTFQVPEKADTSEIPIVDVMMISESGSTTTPSISSEMPQKHSPLTLASDETASYNHEDSSMQEAYNGSPTQGLGPELGSSESCKKADHPSPVSVLEVPFTEDTSSSESFGRVSAELHELRAQLQLLKMESGKYAEASSSLVPTEEEEVELSPIVSKGNCVLVADSWKTSYALDVLIDSGLEESNLNMFRTTWYSTDCPLDPKLFDKLEKKYNDESTRLRSERRLLFDRINSALIDIFLERVDSCLWEMSNLAGFSSQWQREGIEDALEKLINQYLANREISDRSLDREMLWSDSKAEIEILGNEIEKLLVDDIITEILCN